MARAFFDRFGNEAVNVVCTDKKGNGFYRGWIEIKRPGLYKLEPGETKDGKRGDPVKYVRVTRNARTNRPNGGGSFGSGAMQGPRRQDGSF